MRTSERLFGRVAGLWEEGMEKPFVTEMAEGTLSGERFRFYMVQDALYIEDYIGILEMVRRKAGTRELAEFLDGAIAATREELDRVHRVNLKALGITEEELAGSEKSAENVAYVGYLRARVEEEGAVAGLVALLHCSWMYAYIAEQTVARRGEAVAKSPYRGWFEEYAGAAYAEANRRWIEAVDRETAGMGAAEIERLCGIFEECARHENRFWDMAYGGGGRKQEDKGRVR